MFSPSPDHFLQNKQQSTNLWSKLMLFPLSLIIIIVLCERTRQSFAFAVVSSTFKTPPNALIHRRGSNAIIAKVQLNQTPTQKQKKKEASRIRLCQLTLLIHVEIPLQNPFLERIGLLSSRSHGSSRRNRCRGGSWEFTDAVGSVMNGALGRGSSIGRGGGERGALRLRDGALGAGSKLLRPVEATTFTWTSGRKVRCSSGH